MPNFKLSEHGCYEQFYTEQLDVLSRLCTLISQQSPLILEIGSWTGKSASILGIFAKANSGHVYTVDWFKGTPNTDLPAVANKCDILSVFRSNMKELELEDVVFPMVMKSVDAARVLSDGVLDLVFIDGDHSYSSVKQDIELWLPKVKKGGIFCGHDCDARLSDLDFSLLEHLEEDWYNNLHPGVVQAVGERFPNCNIEKAVWWVQI